MAMMACMNVKIALTSAPILVAWWVSTESQSSAEEESDRTKLKLQTQKSRTIKEGIATMPCNTNGGLVTMYMSCRL